ncbi:FAD-dependent oxidoreductase [Clostridia bacterium OttesenSCG-928-O13]|nr:FAD-dependent oxidoreductase [Clostridia bacterium OttesenSCG-928-O13]
MKKPVMVVGGGIAGIQASTDLADMGVPVFLVESSPSIGGRMAQLDKTFPTNDCSACILAPKVTGCFNHPLVKTLTLSDLVEVKGEAPNLTAVVKTRPRYVDEDTCKGCDDCISVCPVTVKSEFDMGVGDRHAIYKPFAQAVPNKVAIDKRGTSPCKYNCPAKLDAHGYVTLVGEGRYEEALKVVRRTTPFAGVLGRVCLHPCEENCTRAFVEDPISIASLKRFVADYELQTGKKPSVAMPEGVAEKDDKIAIIGAGPAGLNCAYQLALRGYKPTVFEALPVGGGMLKVGIPDYRLDKNVLQGEIDLIAELGVDIRYGQKLGADFTVDSLKEDGYKAIFLAVGAHKDQKMGVPGEDNKSVISSVDFLREVNLGGKPDLGKKVLVIGGGNVAMDAARTALRLGAKVTVVYRRTRAEMPANEWEIHHALEEGVQIMELATQKEVVVEDGKMTGLRCVQNQLGDRDASGRRRPVEVEGSDYIIEADTIVVAIGQKVDSDDIVAGGVDHFNRWGTFETDGKAALPMEGVFAGGDAVRGPATAVEAVADGNRAAIAITNYLEGKSEAIDPFVLPQTDLDEVDLKSRKVAKRASMPMISLKKRQSTFEEVETGYDEETAKAEANRCVDCSVCCECKLCEEACGSGAIRHCQQPELAEIPVSAVVLAPGYDTSQEIPSELGYTRYEDVVTSLEYERILSASGPYGGHVQRPSDGKAPERIAFIQCVGSRDAQCNAEYCSAVCCMYAVKEAQITKEHLPTVKDIDIYYMDMRAYGKEFDRYVETAKNKYNIGFVRSRVGGVERDERTGQMVLTHCGDDGNLQKSAYDMVVLSVGMQPGAKSKKLFKDLGVKTDQYGFVYADDFAAPATSRDGILACGVAAGPKDIPETVVEASAAAAGAARLANTMEVDLYKDYSKFFVEEPEVPIRDVSKEPIRIGVFVCHCGVNIGGYLTVSDVVAYAKTLPYVAYATESLYTCSVDAQKTISDMIAEHNLNRVVVASCTPRTHEPLFQGVLKKSGLNPYLFAMANIRDQCSWVHMDDREAATNKAKQLVSMAVGKVAGAKQLQRKKINVDKAALVIGGGMSGLSAASELSGMGYHVHLVDRQNQLGGKARMLGVNVNGRSNAPYLQNVISGVLNDANIDVYTGTNVENIDGYVGNFSTKLATPEGEVCVTHGVVVVAVGANERRPEGYFYGKAKNVFTHIELENALKDPAKALKGVKDVVMIQCVDQRNAERMYCSRVCCNQAVRNAIAIKQQNPDASVTVLYREMRTYGTWEAAYTKARNLGVQFVRFEDDAYPTVEKKGSRFIVTSTDPLLGVEMKYSADILSLASVMEPDVAENTRIAQMLKVPLNGDGFFMEAHAKLRPVDFATEGVYLAGLAHSPKNFRECMVQGRAAASRAATVISKDKLETEGTIAKVDPNLCVACGVCETVCPYNAVAVEEVEIRRQKVRKAMVNDVLCKGCGTCSASCRCGAIDVGGFSDTQVLAELSFLLRGNVQVR